MKNKGLQQKLLYPAMLSIKMEGQIRSFLDKRILQEYNASKPHFTVSDAKGSALRTGRKTRQREEHRHEKMAMNKYLSTITLHIHGLNAPIKR